MRAFLRVVAVASLLAAPAAGAQQVVSTIDFEGVATNAAGFNAVPLSTLSGYAFENWGVLTTASTFGTGSNAAAGSGKFAYGFALQPQFIYRNDSYFFDLTSAFLSFRTFDGNVSPGVITVRGYRGASEVFSQNISLTNTAQLFTFDWTNLSEVEFASEPLNAGRSAVLAMDNVSLTATVPEPATVALVGAGLAVVMGGAWRRRRAA